MSGPRVRPRSSTTRFRRAISGSREARLAWQTLNSGVILGPPSKGSKGRLLAKTEVAAVPRRLNGAFYRGLRGRGN